MREDEVRLQAHLDEHPEDGKSRRILADLLDDQGDEEGANCQRWLAEHEKWPDNDLKVYNLSGWHWWACPDLPQRTRDHAVLPEEVQAHMPRGEWRYATRRDAEEALAKALAKVGQ
jgi:hypothetical protein